VLAGGLIVPRIDYDMWEVSVVFASKSLSFLTVHSDTYSIGDVTNLVEQKQFIKATNHAQIAAANILAQLSPWILQKTYLGQPELIIITNGKADCRPSHSAGQLVLESSL
jgi:hypothetical protein